GDVTIEAVFTGPDLVGIADADAEAVQVYATDGVIYINGYEGEVKVVNISGQVVKEFVANGNAEVSIAQGIYFVVSGDQVTKVVVK
ncbi:MAG: T9SS type A sorting domain-containing protein, partial [Bacteroidales bacterium]|nr:T9SS type A sorting domain-containing protein [Bacteroidales bacterium]